MSKTHQKRHTVPKNWPVARKGTTFVVKSNHGNGIPILVALRDMLKVAKTRKEVKIALNTGTVLINQKKVLNDKNAVCLFDIVTLTPSKNNYKMVLSDKGKFMLIEIPEKEAQEKISKVISKKILKGKKVQLNMEDGLNILSDTKCRVNDSLVISLKDKKIIECLELKKKAQTLIIAGKHAGVSGSITNVDVERKMVEIDADKIKINALIKQIILTK